MVLLVVDADAHASADVPSAAPALNGPGGIPRKPQMGNIFAARRTKRMPWRAVALAAPQSPARRPKTTGVSLLFIFFILNIFLSNNRI